MKTKDKIAQKALELFNSNGLRETTLRQIALGLGMSQGNLNYHFKTKSELVAHLYYELVEKQNVLMANILTDQPLLSYLFESSLASMQCLYDYKFILKDLYKVLQSDHELKAHYLQLQQLREQQYLQMFEHLVAMETLRPAAFEGEYQRLYQRLNILGDNWINAADLFYSGEGAPVVHYHSLLLEVIYPYLTEQGRAQYAQAVAAG